MGGYVCRGLTPPPPTRTKQSPNNALPGNIIFQLQRSQFRSQTEAVAVKAHGVLFCVYTFGRIVEPHRKHLISSLRMLLVLLVNL